MHALVPFLAEMFQNAAASFTACQGMLKQAAVTCLFTLSFPLPSQGQEAEGRVESWQELEDRGETGEGAGVDDVAYMCVQLALLHVLIFTFVSTTGGPKVT